MPADAATVIRPVLPRTTDETILREALRAAAILTTTGCWELPRGRTAYPRLFLNGQRVRLNHLAFRLWHGQRDGLFVLHTCDNDRCFNPAHLFNGTAKTNVRDAIQKGRMDFAELIHANASPLRRRRHGKLMRRLWSQSDFRRRCSGPASLANLRRGALSRAKLTRVQVNEIRQRYAAGERQAGLARVFQISPAHMCGIVNGKFWR